MDGRDQIFHILNPADLLISAGVWSGGFGHRHIFPHVVFCARNDPNLIIARSNYDRNGMFCYTRVPRR